MSATPKRPSVKKLRFTVNELVILRACVGCVQAGEWPFNEDTEERDSRVLGSALNKLHARLKRFDAQPENIVVGRP